MSSNALRRIHFSICPSLAIFAARVDAHRHVEEFFVEERHRASTPHAESDLLARRQSVATDLAHGLLVEGTGVGRLVEIEVAAENLVGTLAESTILMPIDLMTRASRYIGVEARTVVTS